MAFLIFIIVLFFVCITVGRALGRCAAGLLFPDREEKPTYIDKSVHHHHHYHSHTHQNLTIIDEETHKKGLGHFSDSKQS